MPSRQFMFSAINPEGKRVHKRRSRDRDFIKGDFRKFVKMKKLINGPGSGAVAVELLRTGEPIEIKGWVLMIETRTDTEDFMSDTRASGE